MITFFVIIVVDPFKGLLGYIRTFWINNQRITIFRHARIVWPWEEFKKQVIRRLGEGETKAEARPLSPLPLSLVALPAWSPFRNPLVTIWYTEDVIWYSLATVLSPVSIWSLGDYLITDRPSSLGDCLIKSWIFDPLINIWFTAGQPISFILFDHPSEVYHWITYVLS